ncbi:MAG: hypothetical protein ABSB40_02360 [Nitrososphaeria archaeon]|jgi:hypothetical protein
MPSNIDKYISMISICELASDEIEKVKGKIFKIKEKIVKYQKNSQMKLESNNWRENALAGFSLRTRVNQSHRGRMI